MPRSAKSTRAAARVALLCGLFLAIALGASGLLFTANSYAASGAASTAEGSMAYVYVSWETIASNPGNVPATSPHGGYTTVTEKCAVCHAVHVAAPSNTVISSNFGASQSADTLLRMKASDSCTYCHIAAPNTVGDPVFGGVYPIPAGSSTHDNGDCQYCHTSIHGVGADQAPSLLGLMLRAQPSSSFETTGVANTTAIIDAYPQNASLAAPVTGYTPEQYRTLSSSDVRQQAVGVFCVSCHNSSYVQTIAGAVADSHVRATYCSIYSGHRTHGVASSDWGSPSNRHSTVGTSTAGLRIAWADSTQCLSCHDSKNGFGGNAFPHGWGTTATGGTANNAPLWMLSANFAGASPIITGSSVDLPSMTYTDGFCLKCHRGASGTSGVGIDY